MVLNNAKYCNNTRSSYTEWSGYFHNLQKAKIFNKIFMGEADTAVLEGNMTHFVTKDLSLIKCLFNKNLFHSFIFLKYFQKFLVRG